SLEEFRRCSLPAAQAEVVDHLRPGDGIGPEEAPVHRTVRHPDLDMGVVGLDDLGSEDEALDLEDDRLEETGHLAHPVAEGLAADVDTHPQEDLFLAMEGEMVPVLRDGDVRQETDARPALVD